MMFNKLGYDIIELLRLKLSGSCWLHAEIKIKFTG